MLREEDYLLYPLDLEPAPRCPGCGQEMLVAAHEARPEKPDFISFRCERCARTEKFICDEYGTDNPAWR